MATSEQFIQFNRRVFRRTMLFCIAVVSVLVYSLLAPHLSFQTMPVGLRTNSVDAAGSCKDPGHYDPGECSEIRTCCQHWVSASDPRCTDPGPGGGCCLEYGEECDEPIAPPTISASLSCSLWGNNGWCVDVLNLNLTASDPQGQSVIISGNINGVVFACPAGHTSCSVPITSEGTGTAAYKVNSATGLSASGSTSYKLDLTTPQIDGSLSGVPGLNGWYVSDVTVSASASDAVSGPSSFAYSLDGGAWTNYSLAITLSNGIHTLGFRAIDNAGNQTETSQNISIDTITPNLNLSITGTAGTNGWYTSNVQVAATASDSGSGISALEYSVDSGVWTGYNDPLTLTDGAHSLSVRATDAAGNVTQTDQQIHVDTITPAIDLSITGTVGASGWYVSNIQVNASGSDGGSGMASFEYSLDDGAWTPYTNALPYSDGRYSLKFRAKDNAGNVTTTPAQLYWVDTTPPTIGLPSSTRLGKSVDYSAQDPSTSSGQAGSGLSAMRVVIEDEDERWPKIAWNENPSGATYNSDFLWDGRFKNGTRAPAGNYYVTLKVTDRAGNESWKTSRIVVEETLLPQFIPPFVVPTDDAASSIPAQAPPPITSFGGNTSDTTESQTSTSGSGGQVNQFTAATGSVSFGVPATTKSVPLSTSNILWGAAAAAAVGAFVAEAAERRRRQQGEKDPDAGLKRKLEAAYQNGDLALIKELEFRMAMRRRENSTGEETEADRQIRARKLAELEAQWAQEADQKQYDHWLRTGANPPPGYSDVTVEERAAMYKQILAHQAQLKEPTRSEGEQQQYDDWLRTGKNPLPGFEDLTEEERLALYTQTPAYQARLQSQQLWLEAQQREDAAEKQYLDWLRTGKNPPPGYEDVTVAEREALYKQTPEYQARMEAQRKYEAEQASQIFQAGERDHSSTTQQEEPVTKEKSWWEKSIDWIDNHQAIVAVGIGIAAGAAIILTGGAATPLVAIALIAGGVTIGGTVALNAHYDRPLGTNVLKNTLIAGGTALATVFIFGGGLTAGLLKAGNTVTGYCISNPAGCSRIDLALKVWDTGEQLYLGAKAIVQDAIGDEAGANETKIELLTESMDGGMPGNTTMRELGGEALELVEKYGDDATEVIAKYGDDAIALIQLYGDDAIEIIGAYGDEGTALLLKYGDDAIELIQDYGTPAVKVLGAVNPESAKVLLETLDDDVLDYVIQQGPDEIYVLSRWTDRELREHGTELALRAESDVKVLRDIKTLLSKGPIDPKNLTHEQMKLIEAIAPNSTQYNDAGQIVLGKWVDYGHGFTEVARDTGSAHYNPHPDMWDLLGELGNENQEKVAWLINQQVIQTGVSKGLPFEYTLRGIPDKDLDKERIAIQAIFAGATDAEIMDDILELDYMPIRMREIQELQKAGYEFSYDEIADSFVLSPP